MPDENDLTLKIKGSATSATNALDKVIEKARQIKEAMTDAIPTISEFNKALSQAPNVSDKYKKLASSINSVARAMQKLNSTSNVSLNGNATGLSAFSEKLAQIKASIDSIGDTPERLSQVSKSLTTINGTDVLKAQAADVKAQSQMQIAQQKVLEQTSKVALAEQRLEAQRQRTAAQTAKAAYQTEYYTKKLNELKSVEDARRKLDAQSITNSFSTPNMTSNFASFTGWIDNLNSKVSNDFLESNVQELLDSEFTPKFDEKTSAAWDAYMSRVRMEQSKIQAEMDAITDSMFGTSYSQAYQTDVALNGVKDSMADVSKAAENVDDSVDSIDGKGLNNLTKSAERAEKALNDVAAANSKAQGTGRTTSASTKGTSKTSAKAVSSQKTESKDFGGKTAGKLGTILDDLSTYFIVGSLYNLQGSLANSVQLAMDFTENMNLFTVAMGENIGTAQQFVNAMHGAFDINPSQLASTVGTFYQIGTGLGIANNNAETLAETMTKLAYDMSSYYNISFDDAITKLQSGLTGETEPLRRLGIVVSENAIQEYAYAHGIDKTTDSMTEQEKVHLRYLTILEQTKNAQADFAKTMDSPANSVKIFQQAVQQAQQAIGNLFIPALEKILPIATAVAQVVEMVANAIASLVGGKALTITGNVNYGSSGSSGGSSRARMAPMSAGPMMSAPAEGVSTMSAGAGIGTNAMSGAISAFAASSPLSGVAQYARAASASSNSINAITSGAQTVASMASLAKESSGVASGVSTAALSMDELNQYTKDATKSAKELKRQVLGFDELNILRAPDVADDTGNGGSGGGDTGGLGDYTGDNLGLGWNTYDNMLDLAASKMQGVTDLANTMFSSLQNWVNGLRTDPLQTFSDTLGIVYDAIGSLVWQILSGNPADLLSGIAAGLMAYGLTGNPLMAVALGAVSYALSGLLDDSAKIDMLNGLLATLAGALVMKGFGVNFKLATGLSLLFTTGLVHYLGKENALHALAIVLPAIAAGFLAFKATKNVGFAALAAGIGALSGAVATFAVGGVGTAGIIAGVVAALLGFTKLKLSPSSSVILGLSALAGVIGMLTENSAAKTILMGIAGGLAGLVVAAKAFKAINVGAAFTAMSTAASSGAGALSVLNAGFKALMANPPVAIISMIAGAILGIAAAVMKVKEDMKEADLASRFGDIELSAEDCDDILETMSNKDYEVRVNTFINAKEQLDQMQSDIETTVNDINAFGWKVTIGAELSEEDQQQFKDDCDQLLQQTEEYVQQQQLVASMSLDLSLEGSSDSLVNTVMSAADNLYSDTYLELQNVGKQMSDAIDQAWADGTMTDEEFNEIKDKYLSRITELKNSISEQQYELEIKKLELKYGDVTPESLKTFADEAKDDIQTKLDNQDTIKAQAMLTVEKLESEGVSPEVIEAAKNAISKNIADQKWNLTLEQPVTFELENITSNYQDVISEFTSGVESAFTDSNLDIVAGTFFTTLEGNITAASDKLNGASRDAIAELLDSISPTMEQLESLADEYYEAGMIPPESMTEALENYHTLEVISGDTDAMFDYMAQAIAESPSRQAAVSKAVASGEEIPSELATALKNNYGIVFDAATGVMTQIPEAVQNSKASITAAFAILGKEAPQAMLDAMDDMQDDTAKEVGELLGKISETTNLKSNEIYTVLSDFGISAGESLCQAIASQQGPTQAETIALLTQMNNGVAAKSSELKTLFANLGYDVPQELIDMMGQQEGPTQAAAVDLIAMLEGGVNIEKEQALQTFAALGWDTTESLLNAYSKLVPGGQQVVKDLLDKMGWQLTQDGKLVDEAGRTGDAAGKALQQAAEAHKPKVSIRAVWDEHQVESALSEIEKKARDKRITAKIEVLTQYQNGNTGRAATGGKIDKPQVTLLAEEGWPEMVIPYNPNRRNRALQLWAEAGRAIRAPKWYADGGVFNSASIIGIGEAGREAAIPLNDSVYNEIAKGIVRALSNMGANSAFSNSVNSSVNVSANYNLDTAQLSKFTKSVSDSSADRMALIGDETGYISKSWDNTQDYTQSVWDKIASILERSLDDMTSATLREMTAMYTAESTNFTQAQSDVTSRTGAMLDTTENNFTSLANVTNAQFTNAQNTINARMSTASNTVTSTTTAMNNTANSRFSAIASSANTQFSNVANVVSSKMTSANNSLNSTTSAMNSAATSRFASIQTSAHTAFTGVYNTASSYMSKASSAVDSYSRSIGNSVSNKIGGAVRGVATGVNSVLSYLGSSSKVPVPTFPTYKYGTTQHPGGPAIVNDAKSSVYRELVQYPDGTAFIPKGRNVYIPNLPKGSTVVPAKETREMFPRYAKGVGSYYGTPQAELDNIANQIWKYMEDPTHIAHMVIDKYAEKSNLKFPWDDVQEGAVKLLGEALVPFFKKQLASFLAGGNGTVQALLNVARGEIGYLEKSSNSSLESASANAGHNDWNKYAAELGTINGAPWCDIFVSWALKKAGVDSTLHTLVQSHMNDFKSQGRFHTTNPRAGDLIFYDWNGDNWADHIGIVEKVLSNSVQTIEGNTTGTGGMAGAEGVFRKYRSLLSGNILGYGWSKFKSGGSVSGTTFPASVERWRQLAIQALRMTGQYSAANLEAMLKQIQTESGGQVNPSDLHDSNWAAGHPSKGLMQVIPSTFKAFAEPGYDKNILDPLSNMLAAINYTIARYGSLTAAWGHGHGYSSGVGMLDMSALIPIAYATAKWGGWNAKGGVYTSPTVIGVGEAGREAALPLSKSVYREIAAGIDAQQQHRTYEQSDMGKEDRFFSRLESMLNRSGNNSTPAIQVYLDGKEVYSTVKKYENRESRRYNPVSR